MRRDEGLIEDSLSDYHAKATLIRAYRLMCLRAMTCPRSICAGLRFGSPGR